MKYYLKALKKYAVFNGRATRSEFWYFILFQFISCVIIERIFDSHLFESTIGYETGNALSLYLLAMLIPNLAVCFRRLHDISKSGWFILIPIICWLIAILVKIILHYCGLNKNVLGFEYMHIHNHGYGIGIGGLILIGGWIWFLVLLCIGSNPGENKYGPNPMAEAVSEPDNDPDITVNDTITN